MREEKGWEGEKEIEERVIATHQGPSTEQCHSDIPSSIQLHCLRREGVGELNLPISVGVVTGIGLAEVVEGPEFW